MTSGPEFPRNASTAPDEAERIAREAKRRFVDTREEYFRCRRWLVDRIRAYAAEQVRGERARCLRHFDECRRDFPLMGALAFSRLRDKIESGEE